MEQLLANLIYLSSKYYERPSNVSISIDHAKVESWIVSVGSDGLFQSFDGKTLDHALQKANERYTFLYAQDKKETSL